MNKLFDLFKSITIFEIVLTTVVSVALGVSFWGWTFVYEILKPFLKVSGLNYSIAGFWIFSCIFLPQIIRKPGIALLSSIIAAFVESLLTHWGIISILWGVVQGIGAEVVFSFFMYRKWNLVVLMLASAASASLSYFLDYFIYDYSNLSSKFITIQFVSYLFSAILLAGILSRIVSRRLVKIGLLDQFLIAKTSK